jgi:hypothetical protein
MLIVCNGLKTYDKLLKLPRLLRFFSAMALNFVLNFFLNLVFPLGVSEHRLLVLVELELSD